MYLPVTHLRDTDVLPRATVIVDEDVVIPWDRIARDLADTERGECLDIAFHLRCLLELQTLGVLAHIVVERLHHHPYIPAEEGAQRFYIRLVHAERLGREEARSGTEPYVVVEARDRPSRTRPYDNRSL